MQATLVHEKKYKKNFRPVIFCHVPISTQSSGVNYQCILFTRIHSCLMLWAFIVICFSVCFSFCVCFVCVFLFCFVLFFNMASALKPYGAKTGIFRTNYVNTAAIDMLIAFFPSPNHQQRRYWLINWQKVMLLYSKIELQRPAAGHCWGKAYSANISLCLNKFCILSFNVWVIALGLGLGAPFATNFSWLSDYLYNENPFTRKDSLYIESGLNDFTISITIWRQYRYDFIFV